MISPRNQTAMPARAPSCSHEVPGTAVKGSFTVATRDADGSNGVVVRDRLAYLADNGISVMKLWEEVE